MLLNSGFALSSATPASRCVYARSSHSNARSAERVDPRDLERGFVLESLDVIGQRFVGFPLPPERVVDDRKRLSLPYRFRLEADIGERLLGMPLCEVHESESSVGAGPLWCQFESFADRPLGFVGSTGEPRE